MSAQTTVFGIPSAAPGVSWSTASITQWIRMVRGAYLEIPSLHLTRCQVQRLWGLDTVSCDEVLKALVELRFLERTSDGGFVRERGDGPRHLCAVDPAPPAVRT